VKRRYTTCEALQILLDDAPSKTTMLTRPRHKVKVTIRKTDNSDEEAKENSSVYCKPGAELAVKLRRNQQTKRLPVKLRQDFQNQKTPLRSCSLNVHQQPSCTGDYHG